jgi:hypothetical protein
MFTICNAEANALVGVNVRTLCGASYENAPSIIAPVEAKTTVTAWLEIALLNVITTLATAPVEPAVGAMLDNAIASAVATDLSK